jgi:tetrapyrrole methylase family protein / MazG family protein
MPGIVVVGLGPGGADLLTAGTLDVIRSASEHGGRLFLRTGRHPAASVVSGAQTFDHLYESLPSFEAVYAEIVEQLVAAALSLAPEPIVYAVPGSPLVAEHTVELLLADHRVETSILPALSFLDLTWARLRIDPLAAGVRIVDGLRFATDTDGEVGPLLVSQCHSRAVLSEIKCTPMHPPATVTVLQRLGLPDESIVEILWDDLDRVVEPDHLTSLWIANMPAPVRTEMARLVQVMADLRERCPWDSEQTHESLSPYVVEEAYELIEAIEADAQPDADDAATDHLIEELGDVLFQVIFHACLGAEDGRFDLADIARVLSDKLVRRHPHVFAGLPVADADEVVRNWERIKREERGDLSGPADSRPDPMAGLTESLPALTYAAKVAKRAAAAGAPVAAASLPADRGDVGEYLMSVVVAVKALGRDPETELRLAAARLRDSTRNT